MSVRETSGSRAPLATRTPARSAVVAWAGFLAASATILAVAFG